MTRLHEMGCICCGRMGVHVHHIVDKGYRRLSGGHQATIPLCPYHHVGYPYPALVSVECSKAEIEQYFGPSLALNKRAFVERYGTERELLAKVNALL